MKENVMKIDQTMTEITACDALLAMLADYKHNYHNGIGGNGLENFAKANNLTDLQACKLLDLARNVNDTPDI